MLRDQSNGGKQAINHQQAQQPETLPRAIWSVNRSCAGLAQPRWVIPHRRSVGERRILQRSSLQSRRGSFALETRTRHSAEECGAGDTTPLTAAHLRGRVSTAAALLRLHVERDAPAPAALGVRLGVPATHRGRTLADLALQSGGVGEVWWGTGQGRAPGGERRKVAHHLVCKNGAGRRAGGRLEMGGKAKRTEVPQDRKRRTSAR